MRQRAFASDTESAALRLRLVAATLASTTLLLDPVGAHATAALVVVAYAALAGIAYVLAPRLGHRTSGAVGGALDIAAVTTLVALLPADRPLWLLYVIVVGGAALRAGLHGAVLATAASLLSYDVALGLGVPATSAEPVLAVQAILAAGLVSAELALARERDARDRDAERDVLAALAAVRAGDTHERLAALLASHASRLGRAAGAWVWWLPDAGRAVLLAVHGEVPEMVRATTSLLAAVPARDVVALTAVLPEARGTRAVVLRAAPHLALGLVPDPDPADRRRRLALAFELAAAVAPLLAAAIEAADLRQRLAATEGTTETLAALPSLPDATSVAAEVARGVAASFGVAAIVRRRDGAVVAGDVPRDAMARLVRDLAAPRTLHRDDVDAAAAAALEELGVASIAAVPMADGRLLVAGSPRERLGAEALRLLTRVARAADAIADGIATRDELRSSFDELRDAVAATDAPFATWDADGGATFANEAYVRAFGDAGPRPGDERAEIVVASDAAARTYHLRWSTTPARRHHHVVVAWDVTDERAAVRARDEALASAAHELRNPLTAVHGYAQLMARNLTAVQGQVKQLERLISELLRAGDAETAPREPERVDVADEAAQAVARARLDGGAAISIDRPAAPVYARADRMRIAQIFDNLLKNAAKFSPAGSPVELRVSATDDSVHVLVADRGAGIASEDLPRIFERGYRSPAAEGTPGRGLGLAIAKDIVAAHGGRIWAESAGVGRGTTVHVVLPRERGVKTAARP